MDRITGFHLTGAITDQPNNNISMEDNKEEQQPAPSVAIAQLKTEPFRQARSEHLDLNSYKDAIWT